MVTIHKTNIEKAYDTAKMKAKQLHHPVLLSIVEEVDAVDPLSFYYGGSSFVGERFLWKDRDHTISLVGIGAAHILSTNEIEERFFTVENEWKRLIVESVVVTGEEIAGTGPLLFGGFSFDPLKSIGEEWRQFSNGTFQLPMFMLTKPGKTNYLTVNFICHPDEEESLFYDCIRIKDELLANARMPIIPEQPQWLQNRDMKPEEWKDSVQNVVNRLKQGEMDKVVLARKCEVSFDTQVSSDFVLDNLWKQQPDSFVFSFEREDSCFIGATPERLVKKSGEEILSTCLAGSIARGESLESDEKLGEELLLDEKNRYEHQLVVESIQDALTPFCETLTIPSSPQLMKLKDIQHLYTPVIGQASEHTSLINLVEKLHPTPALGGVPRDKALHVIREEEAMDRGLYAGPVGWIDAYGNGEYAVALRSGLLQKDKAYLYAGCGIVADSQPESEFRETQMKFRPMLRALGGNIND
ncbi:MULTISPECIES: isochorismate synthase MenF [unclassified Rossellomorea]|uniref:isochorismate synthase n=1 Tax=unclassified Rossellomorea TaxID=2837526 RepID=UPI00262AA496|nr:isochorismate synthase [uncultured Rossellomorea sp.]